MIQCVIGQEAFSSNFISKGKYSILKLKTPNINSKNSARYIFFILSFNIIKTITAINRIATITLFLIQQGKLVRIKCYNILLFNLSLFILLMIKYNPII